MARPRVFVSSTFYDLQHVRSDIEMFIREIGYEPVMFERGSVPWSQDKRLEDSCYAEIARCDILVSIIGNSYGHSSADGDGSISQKELRKALDDGKQVYIFVWHVVDSAHRIYALNKDREAQPDYGMDVRVLQFVDAIRALPTTGIYAFSSAQQITNYLREQWAGLFQELLANRQLVEQQAMLNRVSELAVSMERALDRLSKDRWSAAIIHHPGIEQIRELLNLGHRAYVATREEFDSWMTAMGLIPDDYGLVDSEGFLLFSRDNCRVKVKEKAFFSQKGFLNFPPKTWDRTAVVVERTAKGHGDADNDIPF